MSGHLYSIFYDPFCQCFSFIRRTCFVNFINYFLLLLRSCFDNLSPRFFTLRSRHIITSRINVMNAQTNNTHADNTDNPIQIYFTNNHIVCLLYQCVAIKRNIRKLGCKVVATRYYYITSNLSLQAIFMITQRYTIITRIIFPHKPVFHCITQKLPIVRRYIPCFYRPIC